MSLNYNYHLHSKTKMIIRFEYRKITTKLRTTKISVMKLRRRMYEKHGHWPSHNVEKSFAVRTTARRIFFFIVKRKICFLVPELRYNNN